MESAQREEARRTERERRLVLARLLVSRFPFHRSLSPFPFKCILTTRYILSDSTHLRLAIPLAFVVGLLSLVVL